MEAEPPKTEPPKRRRRWYQFSLRALLLASTVAAVARDIAAPRAAVAHPVPSLTETQRQAVADLQKLDVIVTWDTDSTGRHVAYATGELSSGHAEVNRLAPLLKLGAVTQLRLDGVAAADFTILSDLTELERLGLTVGFGYDPGAPVITADGGLARLTKLYVRLWGDVSHESRSYVRAQPHAPARVLRAELIDENGKPQFDEVYRLNLNDSEAANDTLDVVVKYADLRELSLRNTKVSDAGLATLGKLTKLQSLDLRGAKVSKEAVAAFRKDHPKITVLQ